MPPTGALGLLHRVWDGLHRRCPVCRIVPTLDWEWCFGVALVFYLLFTPLVFQYARTVWMYFDNFMDPPSP